jgi:hypothetical protein
MFRPLDRRTFLKAAGVSLALPLLESMSPAIASAATAAPPKRMVTICNTLGLHKQSLFPETAGAGYEMTEYLEILKEHKNDFTLFSGLAHKGQRGGRQPHACEMTWLSAARNPGLDGFRNSISVDQVAANTLGFVTRFPSVVIGSASEMSQSYSSSGVMIPGVTEPSRLFSRLFLQGNAEEVAQKKRNLGDGQSILDALMARTKVLERRASSGDKQQLEEYFEAIRKAEKDITEAQGWIDTPKPPVDDEPPVDIGDRAELIGKIQMLLDMIPLIVQTDSSRVVTLMIHDHQVVPKVEGVSGEHHALSHHGKDPAKIAELRSIETKVVGCVDSLLTQLKEMSEADGNLLDNTMVLFGSNLGNANNHNPANLPIILAGGGFDHGRFVTHDENNNAPLCNLFVTMLNTMGMETESFAQSTGALSW